MMISWSDENKTVLQTIAEREGIYRLLAQTTPENLSKDFNHYSLDPSSRYPNFVKGVVLPFQVRHLFDTDNPEALNATAPAVVEAPRKKRRRGECLYAEKCNQSKFPNQLFFVVSYNKLGLNLGLWI
jgi:hypothetical protein